MRAMLAECHEWVMVLYTIGNIEGQRVRTRSSHTKNHWAQMMGSDDNDDNSK
jgi:hypothetical protein